MSHSTSYEIKFTDENIYREFVLSPYTTNGTISPTSTALDSSAVSANTSLILYGKGMPEYGEGMARNLVHMLEHFSGAVEPVYPVNGQIWFDDSDRALKVFDAEVHTISIGVNSIIIAGNHTARFNNPGFSFRVRSHVDGSQTNHVVDTGGATFNGIETEIFISTTAGLSGGNFVGDWVALIQSNGNSSMGSDLDLGGYKIFNLADPSNPQDAMTRAYADANYLNLSGGVVTGSVLSTQTSANSQTANSNEFITRQGLESLAVLKQPSVPNSSTDDQVMDGILLLSEHPTVLSNEYQAATKAYVDSVSGGALVGELNDLTDVTLAGEQVGELLVFNGSQWVNQNASAATGALPITGGTMTGPLELEPGHSVVGGGEYTGHYAASVTYVNDKFTQLSANHVDNVVVSGGNNLTISYAGQPDVAFTITPPLPAITTVDVDHEDVPLDGGSFIEEVFADNIAYPDINLSLVVQYMSEKIFANIQPNYTHSTVAAAAQGGFNPSSPYELTYKVGYNNLSVFVDGAKLVASTNTRLGGELTTGTGNITKSLATGLANDATQYSMEVSLDGAPGVELTVVGSACQTWGELIDQINIVISGGVAVILDEMFFIVTNTVGSTGNVNVTEPYTTGTGLDLVAALNVDFSPVDPTKWLGVDRDYTEVGNFGSEGSNITFTTPMVGGEIIEVQVTNNMLLN